MVKLNLICQLLLISVCINQVSVDLSGFNKKSEDMFIPTLSFALLLQFYGIHTAAIYILYLYLDKVWVALFF